MGRAYRDPTADAAIGRIYGEQKRQQRERGKDAEPAGTKSKEEAHEQAAKKAYTISQGSKTEAKTTTATEAAENNNNQR